MSSWYGPLWTLISAGLAWLGGNHVGLTALLFRGLSVGAALGAAALLWSHLRRTVPERAAQGLVLFLWNPLLVIETGLSGHNDAIMLALVLLGVWLHLRGWKVAAVVSLTLSVLVKFLTGCGGCWKTSRSKSGAAGNCATLPTSMMPWRRCS